LDELLWFCSIIAYEILRNSKPPTEVSLEYCSRHQKHLQHTRASRGLEILGYEGNRRKTGLIGFSIEVYRLESVLQRSRFDDAKPAVLFHETDSSGPFCAILTSIINALLRLNNSRPMSEVLYTSAISLRRRMVDRVAAAAGVLMELLGRRTSLMSFPIPNLRNCPCATCNCLSATFAIPDAN
jgi:hypothetical protein